MYAYIVSIQTLISEKHANNEETEMTYHLKRMCFVADTIEKALKTAKSCYFGEHVEWPKNATEENILKEFDMVRKINPENPNMSITEQIGYIMETPKLVGEFITITQVPVY